jgi:hypothetical protein
MRGTDIVGLRVGLFPAGNLQMLEFVSLEPSFFVVCLRMKSEHSGPKDLLVGYRTSWGILLQTPVSRFARRAVAGKARSLP